MRCAHLAPKLCLDAERQLYIHRLGRLPHFPFRPIHMRQYKRASRPGILCFKNGR